MEYLDCYTSAELTENMIYVFSKFKRLYSIVFQTNILKRIHECLKYAAHKMPFVGPDQTIVICIEALTYKLMEVRQPRKWEDAIVITFTQFMCPLYVNIFCFLLFLI